MPATERNVQVKLELPQHVHEVLGGWAGDELDESIEAMLEALAYELCQNAELRAYAARWCKTERQQASCLP